MLPLKAALAFGVDLLNHDSARSREQALPSSEAIVFVKRVACFSAVVPAILAVALCLPAEGALADDRSPVRTDAAKPERSLYAVEIRIGPAWEGSKPAQEQRLFSEHSAHLRALREAGRLVLGARYGEVGFLVLSAESLDEARSLMDADPSIRAGVFAFTVHELNVFYPGALEAPPRASAQPPALPAQRD